MSETVVCTYCQEPLDEEQSESPRTDVDGDIMCDDCYSKEYESQCERCLNIVKNVELEANPGEFIAVWRKAPGRFGVGEVEPGYYRVKTWPIFADGMIEGYLFSDHLEKVAGLDEYGLSSAEECSALCGPLCLECRKKIEAIIEAAVPERKEG